MRLALLITDKINAKRCLPHYINSFTMLKIKTLRKLLEDHHHLILFISINIWYFPVNDFSILCLIWPQNKNMTETKKHKIGCLALLVQFENDKYLISFSNWLGGFIRKVVRALHSKHAECRFESNSKLYLSHFFPIDRMFRICSVPRVKKSTHFYSIFIPLKHEHDNWVWVAMSLINATTSLQ